MALLEYGGSGAGGGGDDDVDAASLSEGEEGRREEITSLEVFSAFLLPLLPCPSFHPAPLC